MQHFHLKGINFVYKKKNYKIINNKIFSKDRIFIFFSGNGLYYPNTNEVFKKIIINQDRYEWFGISKNIDCKKIIFVRDIHKYWYFKGINNKINTINKLITMLRCETKNSPEVICVGSSAGGHMASIISSYIKNSYVLNFAGQFNLKPMNFFNYKYFDICKLINKSRMFYFFSFFCNDDFIQYNSVKNKKNIKFFKFKSNVHGPVLEKRVLINLLNLSYEDLLTLHKKNKKFINKYLFSFQLVNPVVFVINLFYKKITEFFK
jgi:hypothetical protein